MAHTIPFRSVRPTLVGAHNPAPTCALKGTAVGRAGLATTRRVRAAPTVRVGRRTVVGVTDEAAARREDGRVPEASQAGSAAQREDRSLRGPQSQANEAAQREDRSLRGPQSQANEAAQREDRSLRGPQSQASDTAVLLTSPRDGTPRPLTRPAELAEVARLFAAGEGPVAVDAERASGYRYTHRAYLVQLRRAGVGTVLIDPLPLDDLSVLGTAIADAEWVLHAASQDLPCLAERGMRPSRLFDTELAARLAGMERVGLAALTETLLGYTLEKHHSAADWSTRPLPPVSRRGCAPTRGGAPPASTGYVEPAPWPGSVPCGHCATRSPPAGTPHPAGCSPTPRSSRRPRQTRATNAACSRCPGSPAGRSAASHGCGSMPSPRRAGCPTAPFRSPRRPTVRRRRTAGRSGTRSPPAGWPVAVRS